MTKNLARDGKAKKAAVTDTPPHHPSMTAPQMAQAGKGGLGHTTAAYRDAPGANPLPPEHEQLPKSRGAVKISPGMRSRTSYVTDETHAALGAAVLEGSIQKVPKP